MVKNNQNCKESEEIECVVDHSKKFIILEGLEEMALHFITVFKEMDGSEFENVSKENLKLVCSLTKMVDPNFVMLKWIQEDIFNILSKSERMAFEYPNNLDSIAEYDADKEIHSLVIIPFALLDVIYKQMNATACYLVDFEENGPTFVYM